MYCTSMPRHSKGVRGPAWKPEEDAAIREAAAATARGGTVEDAGHVGPAAAKPPVDAPAVDARPALAGNVAEAAGVVGPALGGDVAVEAPVEPSGAVDEDGERLPLGVSVAAAAAWRRVVVDAERERERERAELVALDAWLREQVDAGWGRRARAKRPAVDPYVAKRRRPAVGNPYVAGVRRAEAAKQAMEQQAREALRLVVGGGAPAAQARRASAALCVCMSACEAAALDPGRRGAAELKAALRASVREFVAARERDATETARRETVKRGAKRLETAAVKEGRRARRRRRRVAMSEMPNTVETVTLSESVRLRVEELLTAAWAAGLAHRVGVEFVLKVLVDRNSGRLVIMPGRLLWQRGRPVIMPGRLLWADRDGRMTVIYYDTSYDFPGLISIPPDDGPARRAEYARRMDEARRRDEELRARLAASRRPAPPPERPPMPNYQRLYPSVEHDRAAPAPAGIGAMLGFLARFWRR